MTTHSQIRLGMVLILLLGWFTFSALAEPAASTEKLFGDDLAAKLAPAEVHWIKDGDSEFLTLQKTAMTSITKGTVILVPDWSQHAASPKAINYLRKQLIDYGWNTVSLLVPEMLEQQSAENLLIYQTTLATRLTLLMDKFKAPYQHIIVIAQGSSGALLNQLYQTNQLPLPHGLVLLSAYLTDTDLNTAAITAMATHAVPTLDIQQDSDHPVVMAHQQLRQQLTRKHIKNSYRQRSFPGSVDELQYQTWLFKEIYGWLQQQGF